MFDTARRNTLSDRWRSPSLSAGSSKASCASASGNGHGSDAPESRRRRRDRLRDAGDRLREDATFWLVPVPERLPIEETARAADTLTSAGLHLGGLIVNRVLPGGGPDPTASSVPENTASGTTTRAEAEAYLRARRRQQDVYLAEIDRRFADLLRLRVAQAPNDVIGTQALSEIAASLDGMNPGQPPM